MTKKQYDVIVVGGGHAGIEAALASSRLGYNVALCTLDPGTIGMMPCNPSIGGPAKGQIVGEVDALGGEMGRAADQTFLQMKILNRSRGPAVQCLRAQSDKILYSNYMIDIITKNKNITVLKVEVQSLLVENNSVCGIKTSTKDEILASSVVITTGTFLKAMMHSGFEQTIGGRIDEKSCDSLSGSLSHYLRLGRFKTGTPPRLHKDSIDYSQMTIEPGDSEWLRFSFRTQRHELYNNQLPCYRTETTPETHSIILSNLDRSPLYTDVIKGKGPRYCPSIEDKVVRFKEKPSHYIFIEPESRSLDTIYPQGLNTSLPHDIQKAVLQSMPGLRDVEILKWGYAVEYDYILPSQLKPTLETHVLSGLFCAGQINGTSGYEEAAGQGIIAGINAGLHVENRTPFILTREDSFIGTLIDDLIYKEIVEPYRMLTSRSEYRLLFRQDNPTDRLSEKAYQAGLLTKCEIATIREKIQCKAQLKTQWKKQRTTEDQVKRFHLKHKIPLIDFAKRPDVIIKDLLPEDASLENHDIAQQVVTELRYDGYIQKQKEMIEKVQKWSSKKIPSSIDFEKIPGLKQESRIRLNEQRPKTFYEASRIAGINPADISVLLIYLEKTGLAKTKVN